MPHGAQRNAPAGKRDGDAAAEAARTRGTLAAERRGAVLAEQRMQPVDAARATGGRHEQAGEGGQRRGAVERAGGFEHLVDEVAVDPVEQRKIKRKAAVGGGEGAPEAAVDPFADGVTQGCGRRVIGRVAAHAQRDRPTVGLGGDGGKAVARQREAKEAGDVGFLEAEVVGADDVRVVKYPPGGAEPGRERPVGHGEM